MSIITNSIELHELTANHYKSSDFKSVKTDVLIETENIMKLVGSDVYDKAKAEYDKPADDESTKDQSALVQHIQLPIALMATFRYQQGNLVTHGDNGRKVIVDRESESMAWEWMLDKDDEAQLRKAHAATDRLINYLEKEAVQEWLDSDARKTARELFVNSSEVFQRAFPDSSSPRFFYTVVPFIRTIQLTQIKPALGDLYDTLLEQWKDNDVDEEHLPVLELVQQASTLLTMAMAARRLSLQVMPDSVVQNFKSSSQTLKASGNALQDTIRRFRNDMLDEGVTALDHAKHLIYKDKTETILLPKNDACNKFMRT